MTDKSGIKAPLIHKEGGAPSGGGGHDVHAVKGNTTCGLFCACSLGLFRFLKCFWIAAVIMYQWTNVRVARNLEFALVHHLTQVGLLDMKYHYDTILSNNTYSHHGVGEPGQNREEIGASEDGSGDSGPP